MSLDEIREKIREAKARLPLPDLMARYGLGDRAKKSARCPFHDDKRNSFSVYKNGSGEFRFKCHAGCGTGDEISFLEFHEKFSRGDAIKRFLELAGNVEAPPRARLAVQQTKPGKAKPTPKLFQWQRCVAAFTDSWIERIAKWRGLSPEFVRELRDRKQIGVYQGLVAFPVRNEGVVVGVHVRSKNGKWFHKPDGINAAPMIFGELIAGEPVQFFESTWDGLAYMDKTGERSGVIITRGCSNGKFAALIPERCTVYAWKQNDKVNPKTGTRPGDDWLKSSREHAKKTCTIKLPKIPAHDFNDWTQDGATSDDVVAAKLNAETVREAEFVPTPGFESPPTHGEPVEPDIPKDADDKTITRLAALSRLEYERVREAEAEKLGCRRVSILDSLVRDKQLLSRPDDLQGNTVDFADVEPYETAVNGAEILDEVAGVLSRYVVMPSGAADAIALWTAQTHCFEAFQHVARLNCCSPDKSCGKTTLLDVIECFVARPLRAENITSASVFRLVEKYKPTLLLDEVDTYLNEDENLRGCLNAGHKRGGKMYRCQGDDFEPRSFSVFAPAALAGIGTLAGTLHDRSIVIKLVRAKAGEIAARFDSRRVQHETELCRKLARWTKDNFEQLKNCDPQLPETAFNRLADNWRPLFAIAEKAGGDWPKRAHAAFVALTSSGDLDAQGVGTLLLSDIAVIFATKDADKPPTLDKALAAIKAGETADRLPSSNIAESLAAMEGRPWAEWGRQRKPISTNQLANQLRKFGISPKPIRIGDDVARGYLLEDFSEAFDRYLSIGAVPDRYTVTKLGETPDSEVLQAPPFVTPQKEDSTRHCNTVTPPDRVLPQEKGRI